jgi:hypothetical protein
MATDKVLETSGKRFTWFVESNYQSVPRFCEAFGFNSSQVYRIAGDKTAPRFEKAIEYAATGINVHWLATGQGPWWAPNEVGRTLARKRGIVIDESTERQEPAQDYLKLVHDVFEFAEESIRERLANSGEDVHESAPQGSRSGVSKPSGGQRKR